MLFLMLCGTMQRSGAASSDDAGLLRDLSLLVAVRAQDGEQPLPKRLRLRRADYAGSQIFQPHAPSTIEKAPLKELWQVVRTGNKWTEFYSYLAHPESLRQGVAISKFAQTLKRAIAHFREAQMKHILKDTIYERVQVVVDALHPHLEVLDGGYNYKSNSGGFAKLGRTISTKGEAEVQKACAALYVWLKKPEDAFRAYLQIMSGAGVVYAAQCEEKVLRAAVVAGGYSESALSSAAKQRLCTDAGASMDAELQDDRALTQDL